MAASRAEQFFGGNDLEAVLALERGDSNRLQQALTAGADINRPGHQGVVPFLYFIAQNDPEAMVRLFKLGARFDYELPRALGPNFPEYFGWVPANPDTTMLRMLLKAGLDPNYRPDSSWTLIFYTINPFNRQAFELLLNHGADINAQSAVGSTVLHDAIDAENYALARFLIDRGADPTLKDSSGYSAIGALHWRKAQAPKGSPIDQEIDQLLDYLAQKGFH